MIDQDGPEPSERTGPPPQRHAGQQRDGTRSIRGRLEAGAYWEAILAKEAAPDPDGGAAAADAEAAVPTPTPACRPDPAAARPSAITTHSKRLAAGPGRELGKHNGLPVTVIVSTTLQDLEKGAGLAVTGAAPVSIPTLIQMAAAGAHHYLSR